MRSTVLVFARTRAAGLRTGCSLMGWYKKTRECSATVEGTEEFFKVLLSRQFFHCGRCSGVGRRLWSRGGSESSQGPPSPKLELFTSTDRRCAVSNVESFLLKSNSCCFTFIVELKKVLARPVVDSVCVSVGPCPQQGHRSVRRRQTLKLDSVFSS